MPKLNRISQKPLMQHFKHYLLRRAEKPYPLLIVKEHPSAE